MRHPIQFLVFLRTVQSLSHAASVISTHILLGRIQWHGLSLAHGDFEIQSLPEISRLSAGEGVQLFGDR